MSTDVEREAFEKGFPVPMAVYWSADFEQYEARQMDFEPDADEYHRMWQVWQAARAQGITVPMARIAESKVRQLGGDVCGVLVRKDGRLAAVDEHGRVQWLQDRQGAEAVATIESIDPMKCTAVVKWAPEQNGAIPKAIDRIGAKLYTQPQPAVPDKKPLPDLFMAWYHEAIGWNACVDAMLARSPQPPKEGE